MSDEPRKAKERSPNFPYISLEQALERARQFFEMEKRGSAPFTVAAEHWHYSPSSSGAMQTVAALKSYGLIGDEGSGLTRKVRLTDLALRILLDARPESAERDAYKRQAARMPPVVAEIYQKWGGSLPSDANLNHYLVLERGFNSLTAARAVDILKQNQKLTSYQPSGVLSDQALTWVDETKEPALITQTSSPPLQPQPSTVSGTGAVFHNERMVFSHEIKPQHSLKLFVSGPVDSSLLNALSVFLEFHQELNKLNSKQGEQEASDGRSPE